MTDGNEPPEFELPVSLVEVRVNTEANTEICEPVAASAPEND